MQYQSAHARVGLHTLAPLLANRIRQNGDFAPKHKSPQRPIIRHYRDFRQLSDAKISAFRLNSVTGGHFEAF
jgi:hypothetical protein